MDNTAAADTGQNLLDYLIDKACELEGRDLREMHWLFDSFRYEFPLNDTQFLTITREDMEGISITKLKAILSMIDKYRYYPNILEMNDLLDRIPAVNDKYWNDLNKIMDKKALKLSKKIDSPCSYCKYINLCSRKGVNG